ncbi:MAG: hypothetical protein H6815_04655 [Phycisphaeraceae bacterium]|nr:hypothetical protein [Phycisphaerales bacterium]MCB9859724.1 hypothetical protein [Phycisphaeraceae bacterium]
MLASAKAYLVCGLAASLAGIASAQSTYYTIQSGDLVVYPGSPSVDVELWAHFDNTTHFAFAGLDASVAAGDGEVFYLDGGQFPFSCEFGCPQGSGTAQMSFLAGQLHFPPSVTAVHDSPVHVLTMRYNTSDFTPRTVQVSTQTKLFDVYLSINTPNAVSLLNELEELTFDVTVLDQPPCYADCDNSGALNIFDYICFGNAYSAGSQYADCDGSGTLNIFDYICFGNAYAAGCP